MFSLSKNNYSRKTIFKKEAKKSIKTFKKKIFKKAFNQKRFFEPIHSLFNGIPNGLHVESFFGKVNRFGFCHADRVGVNFLEQIEVFLFKLNVLNN